MILPTHQYGYLIANGDAENAGTIVYQDEYETYKIATVYPSCDVSVSDANGMYRGMGGEQMTVEQEIERWASEYDATYVSV